MQEFFSMKGPFARFMNLLWDLICISFLFFLCSIPVFTLGAASTAAYYTGAKVIRHQTGHVFSEFFSSFQTNFKQSTVFTFLYAAVLLILVLDCVYFYGSSFSGRAFFLYLFYLMILMALANMCWFFPLLSRFSMTGFQLLRMATVISFRHLLTTILLLLLLIAALLGIYLMPWGILLFPGLAAYLATFLAEPILRKYSPTPEEGSEEAQKWYYQ